MSGFTAHGFNDQRCDEIDGNESLVVKFQFKVSYDTSKCFILMQTPFKLDIGYRVNGL